MVEINVHALSKEDRETLRLLLRDLYDNHAAMTPHILRTLEDALYEANADWENCLSSETLKKVKLYLAAHQYFLMTLVASGEYETINSIEVEKP